MTNTTNNTQLTGYKEFVQSLEKIGEALLDKYDLKSSNRSNENYGIKPKNRRTY